VIESEPYIEVGMDVPEDFFYLWVSYMVLNKPLDKF